MAAKTLPVQMGSRVVINRGEDDQKDGYRRATVIDIYTKKGTDEKWLTVYFEGSKKGDRESMALTDKRVVAIAKDTSRSVKGMTKVKAVGAVSETKKAPAKKRKNSGGMSPREKGYRNKLETLKEEAGGSLSRKDVLNVLIGKSKLPENHKMSEIQEKIFKEYTSTVKKSATKKVRGKKE